MQTLLQNQKLVFTINLLLKNSNTEIMMYNVLTRLTYVLKEGTFVETDYDIYTSDTLIHPDDIEQYRIDLDNIITAKTDYIISSIRILAPTTNDYRHFEYIFIQAEKDYNGNVTSYYYSRRDVTSIMMELSSKERIIGSFNLAIRSTNLTLWRFDIKSNKITLNYNDGNEIVLTLNEIIADVFA